jgi:hypothetical protein
MSSLTTPQVNSSDYRWRVIGLIGVALLATIAALGFVGLSQSMSGDNVAGVFAGFITFLTFASISVLGPGSKREHFDFVVFLLNLVASFVIGVLSSLAAARLFGAI